jgi:AcrR family transcriptional regulator
MPRLSKEDWIKLGFDILSEFAQDKLKIQYLCERMGVTRGSFYHHFESMEAYLADLMRAYEDQNTLQLLQAASVASSLQERVAMLDHMISLSNHRLEAAIRSFAFYNETVKQHLDRVDAIRLEYLGRIYQEEGSTPEVAAKKAKLSYATLIGVQMLDPDIEPEKMLNLYQEYPLHPG